MYKPLVTLITAFDSHGIFVASAEHRYIDDQGNHALGFWRVMRRGDTVVTVKHESEARSVLRGWGGVKLVDSDRKY